MLLTGHEIGEKLTLIKYSIGNNYKWNAVEVKSFVVPSTCDKRKNSIKLYEEAFPYIDVSKRSISMHLFFTLI
jgi:hypothetical protein